MQVTGSGSTGKTCSAEDCPGVVLDYTPETTWKHDAYWGSVIIAFLLGLAVAGGILGAAWPKSEPNKMTYEIILRMPGDGTAVLQPSMEIIWPKKTPGREY